MRSTGAPSACAAPGPCGRSLPAVSSTKSGCTGRYASSAWNRKRGSKTDGDSARLIVREPLNVRAAPTLGARHRGASLCVSDDRAARGERDEERDDKSGHTSVHSSTTCVCSQKSNSPTDLKTPGYGGMVVRALLFSTVISLQLARAAQRSLHRQCRDARSEQDGMGDLVITPALGVAWMVSEDVIDAPSVPAPGVLFVQGEWACFSFATSSTAGPAKCRPMSRSSSAYRSSPQKKGEGPEPHATFRTRRTPSSAITTSTPSVTTDIRISA